MSKLRDELPREFFIEFSDVAANKHLDANVIREFKCDQCRWIGKHRHVYNWWLLDNGYAVGWNENPSTGWAFPTARVSASLLSQLTII